MVATNLKEVVEPRTLVARDGEKIGLKSLESLHRVIVPLSKPKPTLLVMSEYNFVLPSLFSDWAYHINYYLFL